MARLKFLVFSLAVLGLWAAHLYLLSPALSARAAEQSSDRASAVPAAVKARMAERRLELQRIALKIATHPQALAPLRSTRAEPPSAEALTQLRTALGEAIPSDLSSQVVVAIANEQGSIIARGTDAPSAPDAAVDVAALVGAGADGVARDAFGETHFFFSVPVTTTGSAEPRTLATVVVGAPLLSQAMLGEVAQQTGADGVGLIKDGKLLSAAGAQQQALEARGLNVPAGAGEVFERGSISALGPLKLPLLTSSNDAMGGGAPLRVAHREALPATPFEVVAVSSVAPFMTALADYQKLAVFIFAGLFGATVLFTLIMGGGAKKRDEDEAEQRAPAPVEPPAFAHAAPQPEQAPAAEPAAPAAETNAAEQEPPEASPDDFFPFAPAPSATADAQGNNEVSAAAASNDALFGDAPQPMAAGAEALQDEQPTRSAPPAFDAQATMAYPSDQDPFALANRQEPQAEPSASGDFNPEATRVAAIPDELLRASAQSDGGGGSEGGLGVAAPRAQPAYVPPPIAAPAQQNVLTDDAHFQDVFREFVKTREQCGEPQDGLTFEKFALKLKKNKEQLVAKYHCKTVRFTVYVKEGKAALKATPIKE